MRRLLKRLERAGKRLALRVLEWLVARHAAPGALAWDERPHRVLFLRHDRIGDMILSTGLIRAIAGSHPKLTLDVLASPINAPILRAEPAVGDVVVLDRTRPWTYPAVLRRLRRARYDAVVDCMVTAPSLTTLLLMLASGARERIGVARDDNRSFYTVPLPPRADARHIVEHLSALLAAFGIEPARAKLEPRIVLTEDELRTGEERWRALAPETTRLRILVNVSSGKAARHWPDERFVAAIEHLRRRAPDACIGLIGAPDERERTLAIALRTGVEHVATPGIRDALALLAAADLVFTPDTSIGHGASAFGKPAVVMFLDGKPPLWGLYGAPGWSLASPDQSLASLPLEPVLEALDALLERYGACPVMRPRLVS
ncbi:MAG TPA: glycosyltransferase family 9 protein [Candidatus Binatia bacterium]